MRANKAMSVAVTLVLLSAGGTPAASRGEGVTVTTGTQALRMPDGVPEMDRITDRFKAGDYDACLGLLKAAAAKDPALPPGRIMFAKLCLIEDQPELGREALELAAVENPDVPEIYLLFGRLALQANRLTEARLQFQEAMERAASGSWAEPLRNHFLAEAHAGLAGVAERRKDWPAAAASLAACLKLEPANGPARRRRGEALFRQGLRDAARAELEQALKDDPALERAEILLARLFTEEGDLVKAAEWMESAVKVAPKDSRARFAYADWLFENDRAEQARTQVEAAVRLDPTSQDARGLLGMVARQLNDHETAERIFRELHAESPGNFVISNLWALSLADSPSVALRGRAREIAQVNARLYPGSAEALTTLGLAAYRTGRVGEAEQSLRAALATGGGSSETAYAMARVLADRGQKDQAEQWLRKSLEAPGLFAYRNEARAWLGQLEKARGRENRKGGAN